MCISNRIGPPVEGTDFFGRTREIRHANKLLDSGHSLLLSAPRRIGKSSLAKRLIAEKMWAGSVCISILRKLPRKKVFFIWSWRLLQKVVFGNKLQQGFRKV